MNEILDDGLNSFRVSLMKTADKLKMHKGNDYKSLLHLQEKITKGGNEFSEWLTQRKKESKCSMPDSLLYEYAKCLYTNGITTNKLPRETNRYKFVLYAWLQNEWQQYGPIFKNTVFIKPRGQTKIPLLSDNIDDIYLDISLKINSGKLNFNEAADIIAFAEMRLGNAIKAVVFYNDVNKIFIVSTQILKKKHKIVRTKYCAIENKTETSKKPTEKSGIDEWLDLNVFEEMEALQNGGIFELN